MVVSRLVVHDERVHLTHVAYIAQNLYRADVDTGSTQTGCCACKARQCSRRYLMEVWPVGDAHGNLSQELAIAFRIVQIGHRYRGGARVPIVNHN
eukprot:scaffold77581_cov31-Tisochrysis_lutea.AAC.2